VPKSAARLPQAATPPASKPGKARKLSFKETRELEGMEELILTTEQEIARIEELFASPEFHRTHAARTSELMAELEAMKVRLAQHFARWEELEAVRAASAVPMAGG
jgi:ATP-binding cassette subfamily F protein uup